LPRSRKTVLIYDAQSGAWPCRQEWRVNHRVLVIEDHDLWRQRVCAELGRTERYDVVGELTDGAEAVREASRLKPDVVILDISLQNVNGIEAARRIFTANPDARILFLTAQRSREIAEAALATGARGDLLKTEAGGKLELAVETVINGGWFISPGLPDEVVHTTRRKRHFPWRHDAVFHSSEPALIDDYVRFAEDSLESGKVVIMAATPDRLGRVQAGLESHGVAVGRAVDEGRYVQIDATDASEPGFDKDEELRRSAAFFCGMPETAGADRRVAACGAVAPPVWRAGQTGTRVELERFWNERVRTFGADLFCGYLLGESRVPGDDYDAFRQICGCHQDVHVR
jgi:DNA-binding NarL/FixJ family response regulator